MLEVAVEVVGFALPEVVVVWGYVNVMDLWSGSRGDGGV